LGQMPADVLAHLDDRGKALKAAFEEADKKASHAWSDFDRSKSEAETKGLDLSDDDVFGPIKAKHDRFKQASAEAEKAKNAYMAHLERGPEGNKGTKEQVPGSWPTNVSDSFLEHFEGEEGQKALVSGTGAGAYVAPFWSPELRQLPQRRLFIRSLIPSVSHDSDHVWFLRQSVYTNQAAPVAAGALKPTSTITIERVEQPVTTIAHLSEAIDNAVLADEAQLRTFLDQQLRVGVLLAEENQLVNGSGTPPNLRGILNTSGILTQARGADPHVDAVLKALVKVENQDNPYFANGIVLHPTDWQSILLTRDAGGDYQAGESGAFTSADAGDARGDTLWGRPVVRSRAIAQGTALVGDFTAATIWDREQARVTFAEQGGLGAGGVEIYSRNQVVFRAEERLAFGVERPAAFCTVTGL
jgi:HK97 family phage major capsid protein